MHSTQFPVVADSTQDLAAGTLQPHGQQLRVHWTRDTESSRPLLDGGRAVRFPPADVTLPPVKAKHAITKHSHAIAVFQARRALRTSFLSALRRRHERPVRLEPEHRLPLHA